jgi:hypothetical protein
MVKQFAIPPRNIHNYYDCLKPVPIKERFYSYSND